MPATGRPRRAAGRLREPTAREIPPPGLTSRKRVCEHRVSMRVDCPNPEMLREQRAAVAQSDRARLRVPGCAQVGRCRSAAIGA